MSISAPFIRRPVATSLLMAALLLIGIAAYPLLPVAPLPRVDFPTIAVSASLPGGSPETMAATVAQPLERQFSQISGVSQMTSVSVARQHPGRPSSSTSTATSMRRLARRPAPPSTTPADSLPEEPPQPPDCTARSTPPTAPSSSSPSRATSSPSSTVDDYADNILSQQISADLRRVPGLHRRRAEARHPRPDRPGPPRRHGPHARGRPHHAPHHRHSRTTPKGTIDGSRTAPSPSTPTTSSPSPTRYDDVIVAYRNGAPIRIRDIGHAVDGPENARLAGWQNGKRGIQLLHLQAARRQRHRTPSSV